MQNAESLYFDDNRESSDFDDANNHWNQTTPACPAVQTIPMPPERVQRGRAARGRAARRMHRPTPVAPTPAASVPPELHALTADDVAEQLLLRLTGTVCPTIAADVLSAVTERIRLPPVLRPVAADGGPVHGMMHPSKRVLDTWSTSMDAVRFVRLSDTVAWLLDGRQGHRRVVRLIGALLAQTGTAATYVNDPPQVTVYGPLSSSAATTTSMGLLRPIRALGAALFLLHEECPTLFDELDWAVDRRLALTV